MKYLKKFENVGDHYWIVVYEDYTDKENSFQSLYDDQESAENKYLDVVNNDVEWRERHKKNKSKLIITIEEADEYVENEMDGCTVYYYEIIVEPREELREDIKLARQARKYNI